MTTTESPTITDQPQAASELPPCPPWCKGPAGHNWNAESWPQGEDLRGHDGPSFGSHVYIGAMESGSAPGVCEPAINISDEDTLTDMDAEQALALARDLTEAAAWLQAAQKPPILDSDPRREGCPRWCVEHVEDDPPLIHWGQAQVVCRTPQQVTARLSLSDGEPCPLINLECTDIDSPGARKLAAYLLNAADVMDGTTPKAAAKPWSVDGLRVAHVNDAGVTSSPFPTVEHALVVADALNALEENTMSSGAAYGTRVRAQAGLSPVCVTRHYTHYNDPAEWFAFPAEHDVTDLASWAMLIRNGESLTLKLGHQRLQLGPPTARELARLVKKPNRADRLARMLRLFADRADEAGLVEEGAK